MQFNQAIGAVGSISLFLGGVCCLVLLIISLIAITQNDHNRQKTTLLLSLMQAISFTIAVLSLGLLLQRNAFEYSNVFNAVEKQMSFITRFGGLWSGQSGSLLFWSWAMSIAACIAIRISISFEVTPYTSWVSLILSVTLFFFLVPVLFVANPFTRVWIAPDGSFIEALFKPEASIPFSPIDGIGMNPSLRHPAMLLHPPTLYVGLIGFFIPYTFAISSLILKDKSKTWLSHTLPFATASWVFLTCGMFLGSWWAYNILGWGGYWGWDAVEISGLLPWLLSFGLLHAMTSSIKKNTGRIWVYIFAISIVILILFGILLTRSGIIESVHAYSSGGLGPALTLLILLHLLTGLFLLTTRRNSFTPIQKAPPTNQNKIMNLSNILLVLLAALYLFGQTLPLTSQLFPFSMKFFLPEEYERYSAPFLMALLGLTGLYPLLELKKALSLHFPALITSLLMISFTIPGFLLISQDLSMGSYIGFVIIIFAIFTWLSWIIKPNNSGPPHAFRKVSKAGSFYIHIGFLILSMGILAAESMDYQEDIYLNVGETSQIQGYQIQPQSKQEYVTESGQHVFALQTLVRTPGGIQNVLYPEYRYFTKLDTLTASPDTQSNLFRDIQILITDWQRPEDLRTGFRVHVFPMMIWVWIGGGMMSFGGLLQLFKKKLIPLKD